MVGIPDNCLFNQIITYGENCSCYDVFFIFVQIFRTYTQESIQKPLPKVCNK